MKDILLTNPLITENLSETELDSLLAPENYLGTAQQQVEQLSTKLQEKYFSES